ncbi:hypothetical protein D5085_00290 [Ectothiorhodospiraceae bacterium BW-2]|nr:hypothetical protein D5085_00290 [Ectothiorhodospiraceae bacterium BW-2]
MMIFDIDVIKKLSHQTKKYNYIFLITGVLSFFGFVFMVISSDNRLYQFQIPTILVAFWSLIGYAFTTYFHSIPDAAPAEWGWFRRLKRGITRGVGRLLLLFFVVSTIASVWVTYKLISVWVMDY